MLVKSQERKDTGSSMRTPKFSSQNPKPPISHTDILIRSNVQRNNCNNMGATGEQVIQSKDGTPLFVKQYHAEKPVAQVLILHGYLEHCGRYEEFGTYLSAHGISAMTFDLRGHGRSGGDLSLIHI